MKKYFFLLMFILLLIDPVFALINVTLNSPADNFIVTNPYVNFNCSVVITGGNNITNISLYSNNSGSWELINYTDVSGVVSDTITGESYDSLGSSTSGKNGLRFVTNFNLTLSSVKKDPSSLITIAYVLNSTKDVIGTSNVFSGNIAVFSTPVTLDKGVTYYIAGDKNGTTFTRRYDSGWGGYPVPETYINWTGGLVNGADDPNNIFEIEEVFFGSGVSTSEGYFTNQIINTSAWSCQACDNNNTCQYATENRTLIINPVFGLCNSTLNTKILNISFKDETTLAFINATIPSSSFVYYLDDADSNSTYTLVNNTANYEYNFCGYPNRTFYVLPYIQYNSNGYSQRIYQPTLQNYSNDSITNLVLYLLTSANGGHSVTFVVIDPSENTLSNVYVTAVRTIDGSDTIVGSGYTNDAGSITFWLNENFEHDLTFVYSGYDTYSTTLIPTETSYTIQLGSSTTTETNINRGITYSYYPNQDFIDQWNMYNFSYTLESNYWTVDFFNATLYYSNGSMIDSNFSSSNGGILSFSNINITNESYIYMSAYYTIGGNVSYSSRTWYIQSTSGRQFSLNRLFTDINTYIDSNMLGILGDSGTDTFGKSLIAFVILVLVAGGLSYRYGLANEISIMGIIFGIVLFLDYGIGFIPPLQIGDLVAVENFYSIIAFLILLVFIIKEESR